VSPSQPLVEARLLACPDLPTLPAVALRVLALCRDGLENLAELARVIEPDADITAKLLRLASSASLGTSGRIATLSRAIATVGTHATVATVLSSSLVRGRRALDAAGFDHSRFWRRAVLCGIAARALGEIIGGADREEAFLSGLLQDLGVLALARVFPAESGRAWTAAGGDHGRVARLERDAFGFDHVDAGVVLARHWNLPEPLCAAIAGSHVPAGPGSPGRLAEIAFLSGLLAEVWTGSTGAEELARAIAVAEARFGPTADRVAAALAHMALAVPEASSDLDIDLGGRDLADAVETQARALLRRRGLPAPGSRPAVLRLPSAERGLGEAFHHARAHGGSLSAVLVAPLAPGAPVDVAELVGACLRGTDAVALRGDAALALLFGPGPSGSDVVIARIRARALAADARVAIGWVELRPGDGCPGPGALLDEADRALAASRASGGTPARGGAAPWGAGDVRLPRSPPR
jgi:HD-like signal output (HDOD) protein